MAPANAGAECRQIIAARLPAAVEYPYSNAPAPNGASLAISRLPKVDAVSLDGATCVSGNGITVAFDVETGAKPDHARIDCDNTVTGAHTRGALTGAASL